MSFQELQDQLSIPIDRFTMLRLSPTVTHHHSATSGELSDQFPSCGSIKKPPHFSPETTTPPPQTPDKTTVYGGTKRSSDSLFSAAADVQEPILKRAATSLYRTFSDSKFDYKETTKTPSPVKPQFPSPLYRTFSDPTGFAASYKRKSLKVQESPATKVLKKINDGMREMSKWCNQMIQEKEDGDQEDTISEEKMKDRMREMTRKCSQMIQEVADLEDTVSEENNIKMLKRMKDGLIEMSQWFNQEIQEVSDQEDTIPDQNNKLQENDTETGTGEACDEEAVWVDHKGDCLILHFKCPCGKGYQILLRGNTCYYKLD